MRVAVMNNYHAHLFDEPKPRGLRNIVANIENMGNIMFLETITRQLGATAVSAYNDIQRTEYMNENFDILVLPLANMISKYWVAHGDLLDALERLHMPIVLMSVGVQAESEEELSTFEISPSGRRILDLASNTGTTIGTRGALTTYALKSRGYTNVTTIGCPSLYYKPVKIRPKKDNPKIAIHAGLSGDKEKVGNLLSFGVKHADAYIAQNEARFLVNKYRIPAAKYEQWTDNADRLKFLSNIGVPYTYWNDGQFTPDQLRIWLNKSVEFFADIDEWVDYLRDFDLVVGSRYHGTVAALHAGVPSLLYTLDMRTQELAEYHEIPHLSIKHLNDKTTVSEVMAAIDYSAFDEAVKRRRMDYVRYLASHKLSLIN